MNSPRKILGFQTWSNNYVILVSSLDHDLIAYPLTRVPCTSFKILPSPCSAISALVSANPIHRCWFHHAAALQDMTRLAIETWIWYGVTWIVVAARLLSRRLVVGSIKKYQTDDYLMLLAMACDAVLIACINIVSYTSSNLIDPAEEVILTPAEISNRRFGSKLILVVEQLQCVVTWLVKCCLLLMYNRLTTNLNYNRTVKAVAVYVIVGFVVMEILYFGVWCRPFPQYWAVPTENVQCSTATHHLITNATLNISSDIMIILLPMPLFLQSNATAKIKVALCCIYTVGIFTIVSAVLNKYYSFTDPFGAYWTAWYIRESSTALIAANLPLTWPLVRQVMNISTSNQSSSYTPRASHAFDHIALSVPTITTNGNSSLPTLGPSNSEIPLRSRAGTGAEVISSHRVRE